MWINLEEKQKALVLEQIGSKLGLLPFVVEKDWWVCLILRAVFQCKYAESIIFKGGTSLSKAYKIIDRFSEDIDLIIDYRLLGFDELCTKSQIKKLRKISGNFIITEFREELICQLDNLGVDRGLYEIRYNRHVDDTSDPNTLAIYYQSIVPTKNSYIKQRVLLEIGARSLLEPAEKKPIISFIDEQYADLSFTKLAFTVQVVLPTRTFIEKVLLLHEEFSKPEGKIRVNRLSRHFYDLDKIMKGEYGMQALADAKLFEIIVQHRKRLMPLRGIDYSKHQKGTLSILPPVSVLKAWESDYKIMQEHMILGDSLKWSELLEHIKKIEDSWNFR